MNDKFITIVDKEHDFIVGFVILHFLCSLFVLLYRWNSTSRNILTMGILVLLYSSTIGILYISHENTMLEKSCIAMSSISTLPQFPILKKEFKDGFLCIEYVSGETYYFKMKRTSLNEVRIYPEEYSFKK